MIMKQLFTTFFFAVLASLSACSQSVIVENKRTLVDSCGFFPQLSADGNHLLFAPTDASSLFLKDLRTGLVTTVAESGLPGFDARFDADGQIYYVTQELRPGNLVYRTAHRYDPATGKSTVVTPAQHGAVYLVPTRFGFTVVGEHRSWKSTEKLGRWVYTRGSTLYIVDNDKATALQPAGECAGYLWASLSPDGLKVMFEAVGKGLYICDLTGKVIHQLPAASMPTWFDNNHFVAMTNTNFGAQRINGTYIYISNLDGTHVEPITEPGEHGEQAVMPCVVGNNVVYSCAATHGEVKMITVKIK